MSAEETHRQSTTKTARLTAWSRFRFYAGGFFCLIGGISVTPNAFHGDVGFIGAAITFGLVAFGIAYAARGRKKVRDWNALSQWFFWAALVLPGLSYFGNIAGK